MLGWDGKLVYYHQSRALVCSSWVCLINSSYILRLLFVWWWCLFCLGLVFFFLNPASMLHLCMWNSLLDFGDQICVPLIGVWGGSAHLAHALLRPDGWGEDRSSNWVCWGSETNHCNAVLQLQRRVQMIPLHKWKEVQGEERSAVDGGLAGLALLGQLWDQTSSSPVHIPYSD